MFLLSPIIFPWDLAILLMMAGGLCISIMCIVWLKRNSFATLSHKFFVGLLGTVGTLGLIIVFYGSFIEPQIIVVTHHTVHFPIDESLKIAVIADTHVGPYKNAAFLERAVRTINAQLPDLVIMPGDFLYDENTDITALAPLAKLRAPLGVFAVIGNHDAGHFLSVLVNHHVPYEERDRSDEVEAYLEQLGITVLRNESYILNLAHGKMAVAGTDDVWSASHSLSGALMDVPDDMPLILASHNPDIILNTDSHRAELIISGHTHGGQIRLPFIGPVPPMPDRLGRAYDQGLFFVDTDTTLAITRGIGETLARARLLAWPEVMVLETNGQ